MGRRHGKGSSQGSPPSDFEFERTLAAAEEDGAAGGLDAQGEGGGPDAGTEACCTCGSNEFLLEAYLHVVDGRPRQELVEVETLSCPHCGKEYEAVQMEDGRILRGEFQGHVELEDED
ncbi:MAG: hypothetical protein HY901_27195 [Deltaproteobacteria bacterium]|nr:hypothetical protein [Deltaproteobacteria bacterium]